jgi:hypothetical protein
MIFAFSEFLAFREIPCRWDITILNAIRLHIGIMTHVKRNHAYLEGHMNLWGRQFLRSPYSDGMHYISEKVVPDLILPTVIVNLAHLSNFSRRMRLSKGQATKRIASFRYFHENTQASFLLFTTDNAFIWVRNLPYLIEKVHEKKLTRESHFLWGNCMRNREGQFIQGGSGYLLSRHTAGLLLRIAKQWVSEVSGSEDVYFERAMQMVGLRADRSASEFFIGQYIAVEQHDAMEAFNFTSIENCTRARPRTCRPFFYPYNRITVLHRLSNQLFIGPPRPVYDFPDNLLWYQRRIFAAVCVK